MREACTTLEQQASSKRRLWGLVLINALLVAGAVGLYLGFKPATLAALAPTPPAEVSTEPAAPAPAPAAEPAAASATEPAAETAPPAPAQAATEPEPVREPAPVIVSPPVVAALEPAAPPEALGAFLATRLGDQAPEAARVAELHQRFAPEAFDLPDRGHDVTWSPVTGQAVVFARQPGTFAVIFDATGRSAPQTLSSVPGRHFFGHGAFSPDGRLLYATENDFDNARAVVGVYDVGGGFARIGEFDTQGVGAHGRLHRLKAGVAGPGVGVRHDRHRQTGQHDPGQQQPQPHPPRRRKSLPRKGRIQQQQPGKPRRHADGGGAHVRALHAVPC